MAVTRVIRADFKHSVQPLIARRIRQVCRPVFRAFLDSAVLHGRLDLPGYWQQPWVYERAMWFPPVPDPVDRLRDAKADIEEMDSLLRSPQEICAARGRQYEDVLAEIDEAEQMAAKHGLTKKKVSTALANNPAAVAKEE
jgi:capsid protein